MTPQQAAVFAEIRQDVRAGKITALEALNVLEENAAGAGQVPNLIGLIRSWGGVFSEEDRKSLEPGQLQDLHLLATFGVENLPGPISGPINAFDQLIDAGGVGSQQQGELTVPQAAETRAFSPEQQFQQFLASQGPLTHVQRLAQSRQQAPALTAFDIQQLAQDAQGIPEDEQATFLSFLQGRPDFQATTSAAMNVLLEALAADAATQTPEQQAALARADEDARSLIPRLLSQGARPDFGVAVQDVAQQRITGQEAQRIANLARGQAEGPGRFTTFLGGGQQLPRVNLQNLLPTLRSAFVPGQGGFSKDQEYAQTALDQFGIPIIQQLETAGAPGFLRDAIKSVLNRRIQALQAAQPGANVFGEFITGGQAFA